MTALFRSELARLRSRRLFRWVGGLAALGILVGGVVALVRTEGFSYAQMDENLVGVLGFPLILVGWLIGASAIGAEWQHRTVTALLTWEPRRMRVFGVKVVATGAFVVLFLVVLAGLFTAAMAPAAAASGSFAGVDAAFWGDYLAAGMRIAFVGIVAAIVGFSLATIGKNTSAAFGGGFAYLVIFEPLLQAWKPEWREALLGPNMGRVLGGSDDCGLAGHSTAGSAAVLRVWGAVALLVAAWAFHRREMA